MSERAAPQGLVVPLHWLSGQLFSAMLWNGLAGMFARGFTVLGMLLAARILGRELFGQLGIVYQTVMTLQVLAVAGLGTTATTFVAHSLKVESERIGRIMVLCYGFTTLTGFLLALVFLVGSYWIATVVLAAPALADELRLAGLLAFLVALVAVQSGMLIGFKAFRDMAIASFLGGVATTAALALGAYEAGVAGALYGLGIALAMRALLNYVLIRRVMRRRGIRMKLSLPHAELPLLWRFSLPTVLTMALWTLATWSASALLVRQPNGMAEMGLLTAANQWFGALMFIPLVLTQVLLPAYVERLAGDRPVEAGALALRSAGIAILCTVPIVTLLMLLSPFIAGLYGAEFASGDAVFAVAFLAACVMAPYGALANYLIACQRMWTRFTLSLVWTIVLLIGAVILVDLGAIGIAWATLIAYVVRVLVTYVYARHLIQSRERESTAPVASNDLF
jgi:EPS I polysaccharide export inner membrane protein EpsE